MSASDRSYFDILTDLEVALSDISCVAGCLVAMREADDADDLGLAIGYLGVMLREHRDRGRAAFDELFDRLIRGRREAQHE